MRGLSVRVCVCVCMCVLLCRGMATHPNIVHYLGTWDSKRGLYLGTHTHAPTHSLTRFPPSSHIHPHTHSLTHSLTHACAHSFIVLEYAEKGSLRDFLRTCVSGGTRPLYHKLLTWAFEAA